jgi:branched-chain amino acid transport system ATP-binding protein
MKPLLNVTSLAAGYGASQVLFDINFSASEGQVITLLGRNGMGRSTAIKCLFGMLPVLDGVIEFNGRRIDNIPSYQIARLGLGLVPEGRQVFPNLTVDENLVATSRLASSGSTHEWTLERIYRFFPQLGERRAHMGDQLSGGEQQMLAIGRALMTNPRVVVLDEATEGLAPLIRAEIWDALKELKVQGMTLVVIDKNLGPLLELADRHFIIEKGRVVWSGDSATLRSEPHIVHEFLGV